MRRHIQRRHASRNNPPRPDPSIQPVRPLRILGVEARKLYATARAVDEFELAYVHADVRDSRASTRGEEQDISGPQRINDRRDLATCARLIPTHARQANAVPAVRVLNQSGAIETVVGGAAPDVR